MTQSPYTPGPALLLIGQGGQNPADLAVFEQLAGLIATRLATVVRSCFFGFTEPCIAEGIQGCVGAGARQVVLLPLFFETTDYQQRDLPALLGWAQSYWPDILFSTALITGTASTLVAAVAQRANEALAGCNPAIAPSDTAVLVVAQGSRDAESNADVVKCGRLLWEQQPYSCVDVAFATSTKPDIASGIARCVALGARRIVVLPYVVVAGHVGELLREQVQSAQASYPNVDIVIAGPLGAHESVVAAVAAHYRAVAMHPSSTTLAPAPTLKPTQPATPRATTRRHTHGGKAHSHAHNRAFDELLPARYQNNAEISAAPMGAAPLQYDADGRVAWDQIWTEFCDLALAGGPSHRGVLLEPVPPEAVRADPDGYEWVLAELERGIRLVTGLPVVRSRAPGWIGVRCSSEAMALWLLRAIVVENICVRREGQILFLPAGPLFRLEYELKSVITVMAKTHHYWTEHVLDG